MQKIISFIFALLFCHSVCAQKNTLTMNDNTVVRIDSMITQGNKKVKDIVIFGESKLHQGQEIPIKELREELLASRRNLLNTRLFNDVEILIYKWTNDNHVSIDFQVDERWYIYPIPVVELDGITAQEWKDEFDRDFERLTYGLTLKHYNLTGNGDQLDMDWRAGYQKKFAGEYVLTGIDKKRNWGVGFTGNYQKDKGATLSAVDNSFDSEIFDNFVYENKAVSVSISRRKDITRRHTLAVGFQNTTVGDEVVDITPDYFINNKKHQRYGTIDYIFSKEKRNLSEYPTDGEFYALDIAYEGLFDKDYSSLSFTGNVNYYEPIGRNFFVSAGTHFRYKPTYNESFFELNNSKMKELQKPRGYDDYQLFPASFGVIKSELRYQLLDKKYNNIPILPNRFEPAPLKIYPKVFFDAGKLYQASHDIGNALNDEFLYSYGAGVDFVTIYNTPIIIDVSRNHNGKTSFNFGLGKSF